MLVTHLEQGERVASVTTAMSKTWRVVFLLSLVSCVGYLVRADVAVAQERMVPALGLTMTAVGAITAWGFQLAYTVFQVPAGLIGERVGARTALMLAMLGCSVAAFATGLMPESPAAAVPALWITRVLLGISQAAIFPVAAMAVMAYVPADQRVRATSIYISTSVLGAAMAPSLMAPTMEWVGWRGVFVVSGMVAAAAAAVWWAFLPPPAIAAAMPVVPSARTSRRDLQQLIADRHLRLLSLAYLLHSAVWFVFVFWFFRYLIDGRGFTVLASGIWASLPGMAGFVFTPVIGVAADRLGVRLGAGRARRLVAMSCLFSAAAFVGIGAVLPNAILAIVALSLASGTLNGAEAPFFVTATALGAENPGAAAGLLNLMGNLGGVLSIWLVPHMAAAWGWIGTLAFWAIVCAVAALLWLTVPEDCDRQAPATV